MKSKNPLRNLSGVCRTLRPGCIALVAVSLLVSCSDDAGSSEPMPMASGGAGGDPTPPEMPIAPTAGADTAGAGGAMGGAGGSSAGAPGVDTGGGGGAMMDDLCMPGQLPCDPFVEFPTSILELGLFRALPNLSQLTNSRIHEYAPDPVLWSDGLHKLRHVLLPEGEKIDNTNRENWVFPAGSIFIKTFLGEDMAGVPKPVETRFLRMAEGGFFEYAVYQWNDTATDAELVNNTGNRRTPVDVMLGGQMFTHNIPSQVDCEDCHLANAKASSDVIGFDEIRLNSKLDPAAPASQLESFAELGYFTQPLPAEPKQIVDENPLQLAAKRFVLGNCVHCHNGVGILDLRPDTFVENTVGVAVNSVGVMPPPGFLRVVPKDPEKSVLFLQTRGTDLAESLRPMPPVGVQFAPEEGLESLRQWIMSLPAQ